MSGVTLDIKALPSALATIKALKKVVSGIRDLTPAFNAIGQSLKLTTDERYDKEISPNGVKWKENADSTILAFARRKGGYKTSKRTGKKKITRKGIKLIAIKKILRDSGILQDTMTYQSSPSNLRFGSSATTSDYAAIQQFGGGKSKIPARPYLGLTDDDKRTIRNELKNHIITQWNKT